jgi:juvenile hormone diol kinase
VLTDLQKKKLGRLFAIYDVRDNGRLEREDYEHLAHRIAELRGHALPSPAHERITRALITEFERIKAIADTKPRDGAIDRQEWLEFYAMVLADDTAFEAVVGSFVASLFDMFDVDDNALLDADELPRMREALGIPDDGGALVRAIDRDGDGRLSQAEVRAAIEAFFRSDDPDEPANLFFGPLD